MMQSTCTVLVALALVTVGNAFAPIVSSSSFLQKRASATYTLLPRASSSALSMSIAAFGATG
eukprot:16922-Heterococcus_DN1.PRE.1